MILTIRRDGKIFLDEYPVEDMAELGGYLERLVKDKNRTLFLQADREVPYGLVVEVMGEIKAAGIENLGVMADQPEGASAGKPAPAAPARRSGAAPRSSGAAKK